MGEMTEVNARANKYRRIGLRLVPWGNDCHTRLPPCILSTPSELMTTCTCRNVLPYWYLSLTSMHARVYIPVNIYSRLNSYNQMHISIVSFLPTSMYVPSPIHFKRSRWRLLHLFKAAFGNGN